MEGRVDGRVVALSAAVSVGPSFQSCLSLLLRPTVSELGRRVRIGAMRMIRHAKRGREKEQAGEKGERGGGGSYGGGRNRGLGNGERQRVLGDVTRCRIERER